MRTPTLVALAILLATAVHAQYKGKITGSMTDAINKQPLNGATISVLDSTSGMFIKHGVSNGKGEFTITALPLDTPLQVIVTYTGYLDTSTVVRISGQLKLKNT